MFFKPLSTLLLSLAVLGIAGGCSTYVEDRASEEFEPVFPTISLSPDTRQKTGAIYQADQGGLFSKDRRARKVGDILTVDFNEVFAATKAQTAASAKSDSFDLTLPVALPNILTGGLAAVGDANNSLTSGTTQSFSGSGNAAQSNSLTGRLSVTVVRIFDNGNLGILGQRNSPSIMARNISGSAALFARKISQLKIPCRPIGWQMPRSAIPGQGMSPIVLKKAG